MTPSLRISVLICMLTLVAASCPAQQQVPTPGGPVQLPEDLFKLRACSPGEDTATGQCQLTPRQAVDALGKEVKSSIASPQMALTPAYPLSLPNWNLAKTLDPKGATPYAQCVNLLIQASNIVKEVAFPITRHDVPPGELQRLNARLAQAKGLVDEARNCEVQANQVSQNQNPPLNGQVQESGPGRGGSGPITVKPGYGQPVIQPVTMATNCARNGGQPTANPSDPTGRTIVCYPPQNGGAQATPPLGQPPRGASDSGPYVPPSDFQVGPSGPGTAGNGLGGNNPPQRVRGGYDPCANPTPPPGCENNTFPPNRKPLQGRVDDKGKVPSYPPSRYVGTPTPAQPPPRLHGGIGGGSLPPPSLPPVKVSGRVCFNHRPIDVSIRDVRTYNPGKKEKIYLEPGRQGGYYTYVSGQVLWKNTSSKNTQDSRAVFHATRLWSTPNGKGPGIPVNFKLTLIPNYVPGGCR